jgi:hypothetical protein
MSFETAASSRAAPARWEVTEGLDMIASELLAQFSRNRLGGEPVPNDVRILLSLRDELAGRTGIRLEWDEDWAPWLDMRPPSDPDRRDVDLGARLRATREVCRLIAFIAAGEGGPYFGYWRGPALRPVASSPVVVLEKDGRFHLCAASSFAEAILEREYGGEQFNKIRAWLRSLGIPIRWESPAHLTYPHERLPPKELHRILCERYRQDPQAEETQVDGR